MQLKAVVGKRQTEQRGQVAEYQRIQGARSEQYHFWKVLKNIYLNFPPRVENERKNIIGKEN